MITVFHKDESVRSTKDLERVRVRTFHRKNKNGCQTCKRRKIRCDETKPSCLRCTRSGIDCEGYKHTAPLTALPADIHEARSSEDETQSLTSSDSDQFPPPSDKTGSQDDSHASSSVPYVDRSLFQWCLNSEQSRGFQYFHLQTLPMLRVLNHSSDIFYGRCVTVMAVTNDLIRRMTIAVGLFHLECVRSNPLESASALKEYGYSLKHLSKSNNLDRIAVLTACLLFISMEMLRGRYHHAMIHVRRGMNILATTGCDGSKYRSGDPLSSLELFHLRLLISQIAEIAGVVNFVRDGTEESEGLELPDLEKDLEDYQDARRGARKLVRICMNVGVDTEYTQSLWQRWHVKTDVLTRKLVSTARTGVLDTPLIL